MHEIPKPELLDPDRVDRDDRESTTAEDRRAQSQLLAKALGESCAYADQLWEQVNALRGYLLDSLPPDPRAPGPHTTAGAAPTGPDDDRGWERWIDAFATTTSVLCGANGDSGFGLSRAREEAQLRRTAPVLTLYADHPELARPQPPAQAPTPDTSAEAGRLFQSGTAATILKAAAATVVGVLALRGLRGTVAAPAAARQPSP